MNEAAQDVRAVHPESTWAKQRCPFCHGICALVPAVTSAPARTQLRKHSGSPRAFISSKLTPKSDTVR